MSFSSSPGLLFDLRRDAAVTVNIAVLFPLSRAVLTLLMRFDVGFGEPDRAQPVIGEDPYLIAAVG